MEPTIDASEIARLHLRGHDLAHQRADDRLARQVPASEVRGARVERHLAAAGARAGAATSSTSTRFSAAPRSRDPVETFYRRCFIAFEGDEETVYRLWDLYDQVGLWSSDYPHHDAEDAWEAMELMAKHNVPRGDPAAAAGRERAPPLRHRSRAGREGALEGPPPGDLALVAPIACGAGGDLPGDGRACAGKSAARSPETPGPAPALARGPRPLVGTGSRRFLAERYDVLALDFRGHGGSDHAADGRYGFDDYVGDVLAALTALGGPPRPGDRSLDGWLHRRAPGRTAPGAHRRRRHHRHPDRVARRFRAARASPGRAAGDGVCQRGRRWRALQTGAARSPHAAERVRHLGETGVVARPAGDSGRTLSTAASSSTRRSIPGRSARADRGTRPSWCTVSAARL